MKAKLEKLKNKVSKLSQKEEILHHKWYLKHHLLLVEQIAIELSKKYEIDMELLLGLVWVHDYPKIIGRKTEEEESIKELLENIKFEDEYVEKLLILYRTFENKMKEDLSESPIEVQVVSTADGVSHMYGPFYQIYCYENPEVTIEELMESNLKKLEKDWERKIVLPEVKEALMNRYNYLMESFGEIPETLFKSSELE